ncbi:MAG TPA: helix-turn-helix transcriptional regulator [Steroidobacteraceae bacterium]|nr:helix-turn-helix transcriptional regulator [Steroidobacteraceae bacterium]
MTGRRERQESGGFAARLREVVDAYGSASGLAKAIDRSEGAVRKWLRGESEPNVTDLRTVCEKTGTRIEWLVAGQGPRQAQSAVHDTEPHAYPGGLHESIDIPLLEAILSAVREELRSTGVELSPPKESMLVVTLYDLCRERREVDREAVARLVKLAG